MLALDDLLKAPYSFGDRHVLSDIDGKLLGNRKRLRKESLHLSCAGNGKLIFLGKLIHAHYGNYILQFLVSLKDSLNVPCDSVMLLADYLGGEDS